jgi:hypothetical protein
MDFHSIVTAVVAVYGAALSTYNMIITSNSKKRKIRVKISNGFIYTPLGIGEYMLFIEASNPGDRSVTMTQPGILLPNGSTVVFLSTQTNIQFPYLLEEGKSCKEGIEAKELANQMKQSGFSGKIKIKGFYRDALDNKYTSKSWKFDLNQIY